MTLSKYSIRKIGLKLSNGALIGPNVFNNNFGKYPLRFSVFDRKYARITIGKPEIKESKDYITILIDSRPFVGMLRNQF